MEDFKRIEDRVKAILEFHPETRSNDHKLYVRYFTTYRNKIFNAENFIKEGQSFEGISRARRRVQESNPELRDEETVLKRAEMEERYREYYSSAN